MTNVDLQKILQRFPPTARVVVRLGQTDRDLDGLALVLPAEIAVDGGKNLGWAEIVSEAVQVRLIPAYPMSAGKSEKAGD
jgi:hypothetical protein